MVPSASSPSVVPWPPFLYPCSSVFIRGHPWSSVVTFSLSVFIRGHPWSSVVPEHTRNFLDCVKSRKPCVAPAETAHRSITPGHLAYVSQKLGRVLAWDPRRETILDDTEAQRLLMRTDYRAAWPL